MLPNNRIFVLLVLAALLSGCGNRYLSPRSTNPLIEDRVRMGPSKVNKMSVLTSRADRRTIMAFGENKICAEPPPVVAEAIYSESAAKFAVKGADVGINNVTQTALMQLTRRSQGLDYFRTGSFVYCMMWYNGIFEQDHKAYRDAMADLFKKSVDLTTAELENLPEISEAIVQVVSQPRAPDPAPKPTPTPSDAAK